MIIIIIPRPTIQTRPPSDIHHLILAHSSSLRRTSSGGHPRELFGSNMLDKLTPGYSIVLLPGGLEWRVDRSHPNFNGQLRAGMAFPCVLDIVGTSNTDLCIIPHSKFGSRKTPRQFSQQTHTNPSSNAPSALQRNHFLNASLDFVLLAGEGVVLDGENEWERWLANP